MATDYSKYQSKPNAPQSVPKPTVDNSKNQSKPNQSTGGILSDKTPAINTNKPSGGSSGGSSGSSNNIDYSKYQSTPYATNPLVPPTPKPINPSSNTLAQVDLPQGTIGSQTLQQQAQTAINMARINEAEALRNQQALEARRQGAGGIVTTAPTQRESILTRLKGYYNKYTGRRVGDEAGTPYGTYNYAGTASTSPTGRGTIVTPTTQQTKLEQQKQELFEKADLPLEVQTNRIIKDVQEKEIADAKIKLNEVNDQLAEKVRSGEITQKEYETRLNETVQTISNSVNQKIESTVQDKIKTDPSYQQALINRERAYKQLGATTQDGKVIIPKLETEVKQKNKEELKMAAENAALAVSSFAGPIGLAATTGLLGLKEIVTAPRQNVLVYDSKGNPILENRLTTQGKIQSAIGGAFVFGSALAGASIVVKSLDEARALTMLNEKIQSGTYQFSEMEIKSGKVLVDLGDTKTTLNLGTDQIKKIETQIERARGLKVSNVQFESVGSVKQIEILKDLEKNAPELATQVKSGAEVGQIKFDYYGKPTTFNFIRTIKETENEVLGNIQVFKLTKTGNVKRYLIGGQKTEVGGEFTLGSISRKAMPSELPEPRFIDRLKINPILRFKELFTTRTKAKVETQTKEFAEKILKKQQIKSFTVKSPSKNKATVNLKNILEQKQPYVFDETKVSDAIKTESSRIELLGKNKVLTSNVPFETPTGDIFTLSKNVGSLREGTSAEKGIANIIKRQQPQKPIIYKIEETTKPFDLPELKLEGTQSNQQQAIDKYIKDTNIVEEITPSYVGGAGGVNAQSTYRLGGLDYERTLTNQGLLDNALLGIESTGTKLRIPKAGNVIKEDTIFKPTVYPEFNLDTINKNQQRNQTISINDIKLETENQRPNVLYNDFAKEINKALPITKTSQRVALAQPQTEVQAQVNTQIELPFFGVPSFNINPKPFSFEGAIAPPPFKVPNLGPEIDKMFSPRTPKTQSEFKYTSSLGAAAFQAKPVKVSKETFAKLQNKVFGFETRPVLYVSDKSDKQEFKEASNAIDKQIDELNKMSKKIKKRTKAGKASVDFGF